MRSSSYRWSEALPGPLELPLSSEPAGDFEQAASHCPKNDASDMSEIGHSTRLSSGDRADAEKLDEEPVAGQNSISFLDMALARGDAAPRCGPSCSPSCARSARPCARAGIWRSKTSRFGSNWPFSTVAPSDRGSDRWTASFGSGSPAGGQRRAMPCAWSTLKQLSVGTAGASGSFGPGSRGAGGPGDPRSARSSGS